MTKTFRTHNGRFSKKKCSIAEMVVGQWYYRQERGDWLVLRQPNGVIGHNTMDGSIEYYPLGDCTTEQLYVAASVDITIVAKV
jgi:hypothetical protein